MKHRLPILPAVALGMLAAVAAGVWTVHKSGGRSTDSPPREAPGGAPVVAAQPPVMPASAAIERVADPAPAGRANLIAEPRAAELIERAADALANHASLTAKINLHSELFGESLVAGGQYLQGPRESRRVRMELKVRLGDKVCSLQQVSDGTALWVVQSSLSFTRLGRVDVPRALTLLQQHGQASGVGMLALGGLPVLLDRLKQSFDFTRVRSDKLGTVPVLVALGTWKPTMLARLMPEQQAAIEAGKPADLSQLQPYAPNQVEVYIGREDLFPYQIDYVRARTPGIHNDDDDRVLARMKFVDVHFDTPIDAGQFNYYPGETVPVDDTEAFVHRMLLR